MSKYGVSDGDRTRSPRSHSVRLSTARHATSGYGQIEHSGGAEACWPWTGSVDQYGYGLVTVPGGDTRRVSRLILSDKLGRTLGAREVVRHSCDAPSCCNPAHLLTGSQLDNIADREARGRTARGERIPWAKLTTDDVRAIVASADPAGTVAARYLVTTETVCGIRAGRRWNSVTGLPRTRSAIPYARRGEVRRRTGAAK